MRDGNVVSAQNTPLIVSKVGFGAEIYEFAMSNANVMAYGDKLCGGGRLAGRPGLPKGVISARFRDTTVPATRRRMFLVVVDDSQSCASP